MKPFEKINAAIKASPLMILLTMALPQLVLALIRSHDLYMIHEAIQEHHALIGINFLGIPLLLTGLAVVLMWAARRRSGDLQRLPMLGYFLLQTASLVTFLFSLEHLFPDGVDAWIIQPGTFMMVQLASTMPGLFFGFIVVANIRWFNNVMADIGAGFGLFVGAPLFLFIIGNTLPFWHWTEYFVLSLFIIGTLICAFAFLQLMLWLSGKMRNRWITTLIFAVIFPVGGLALNHFIPFPADLQHGGFYVLAVLNGLVLLWGCLPSGKERALCAWITAFSYPFTCYFFILFLPFLPFSILAMIAVGAGFLILTPAVLFILHTRQLVLQFQSLETRFKRSRLITGFVIAFLLVPTLYVARAYYHKHVFFQTLDRVYAAPINTAESMPSPKVAAYALKKLKETKTGVYVPILSETYNRIVFGGMVLPDSKIRQLEQLLIGETSNRWNPNSDFSFYAFFTGRSSRTAGRRTGRPNRNVVLTDATCTTQASDGAIEATVLLTMEPKHTWDQAEFVTDIALPPGVFVSGFELKIGDEMVPARMSDRRAAMWVYHMIRDRARMDPGLVYYTGPNRLRLSVFPFSENENRQCALRFLYPEGTSPSVNIGQTVVKLPGGEPAVTHITTAAGRQAVCIPAKRTQEMDGVFRTLEEVPLTGTDETPGYCPEWDIKKKLADYWNSGDAQLASVPWFTTETEQPLVEFDRAQWWRAQLPDGGWSDTQPSPVEVIILKAGDEVCAISKTRGGMAVFEGGEPLNIQPESEIGPDSRYAKAVDLWQTWWQMQRFPEKEEGLRMNVLLKARELNILIPSTSFLAVESAAQRKALKAAERKSLKSRKSLAFDEFEEKVDSPEPQMLFLMLIVLPTVHWLKLRKEKHA